MQNNLKQAFEKMRKDYVFLYKNRKLQLLLTMIIEEKFNDEIYQNEFKIYNFSIMNESYKNQSFEFFSNIKNIISIIMFEIGDQCYKNFVEKNQNINKIIYLCGEFFWNKKHIFEESGAKSASQYVNINQYEKLHIDYKKYKHENETKKLNKIIMTGAKEYANQSAYS